MDLRDDDDDDDDNMLQQVYPMDTDTEVVTRFVCCACNDELPSDNFFRLERTEDVPPVYFCDGYWCVITIDEGLFGISPHLCFKCEDRNRREQRTAMAAPIACDICGEPTQSGRYKLKRAGGKLFIGTHKCLIFSGEIVSGYACSSCYQRNRGHARRLEAEARELEKETANDGEDGMPSRKKRCLTSTSDKSVTSRQSSALNSPCPNAQPMSESLPTLATTVTTTTATSNPIVSTSLLPQEREEEVVASPADEVDIASIVKQIVSIEEARIGTATMITTVESFLSRRQKVTAALAEASDNVFVAEDFVSMQSHFLQMLKSQLSLIKADQKRCADRLSDANK
jgi:hypothetical protein